MSDQKPGKPEAKPQVEIIPEPPIEEKEGITVDLNSPGVNQEKPNESQPKYVTEEELRKERSRFEYEQRQIRKQLQEAIELARSRPQQQEQVREVQQQSDELEQLLEKDWKAAIRRLASEEAREIMRKEREEENGRRQKEMSQATFQRSQAEALKILPDLSDETSAAAQIYIQVLNENPDLISNPRGPEFTARLTRERLTQTESSTSDNKEVERLRRISAGQAALGRTTSNDSRIVLTQAEKDLCDRSGIKIESYARSKKLGNASLKEGVTVDE